MCAARCGSIDRASCERCGGSAGPACVGMVVKVRCTGRLRFAALMSALCDVFHRAETLSAERMPLRAAGPWMQMPAVDGLHSGSRRPSRGRCYIWVAVLARVRVPLFVACISCLVGRIHIVTPLVQSCIQQSCRSCVVACSVRLTQPAHD